MGREKGVGDRTWAHILLYPYQKSSGYIPGVEKVRT